MANDALYGLDQLNIREQKSADAGTKVVCPFRSGVRDGRKRMCEIIRCKKYEYALPSLLLTEQVRADRTRKGSGDEVNKNEQLKNHCTVGVARGGEVVQWERWNESENRVRIFYPEFSGFRLLERRSHMTGKGCISMSESY